MKIKAMDKTEVERLQRQPGTVLDIQPYVDGLNEVREKGYGTVELEDGDSHRATKRRVTMAAKQIGIGLRWIDSDDRNTIYFKIVDKPQTRQSTGRGKVTDSIAGQRGGRD